MTGLEGLVLALREFIRDEVLPVDDEFDGDVERAGGDALRVRLQTRAKELGLFCPHGPREFGGLGLGMVDRVTVFEEAGRSLFGATAINAAAPDEGNIHMLHVIATASQRGRYLAPLARGEVRSSFAMTEPTPGAGSDPAALRTTATRVEGGWVINGEKHFITGAQGAGFFIVFARTSGQPGESGGATMFLTPAHADGLVIGRHTPTADRSILGGHCAMSFRDLFVPDEDVLGEVDQGFRYVQVRLAPARLTHVMRWLGAARRAHDVAVRWAAGRQAFGSRIADLGLAQQLIADNEIDLAATRALLLDACRELDAGSRAQKSTSIAKTFASEALFRVVDRATQLCGGMGISEELPIAKIAREIRGFRIYDGPSEVHRWSIARRAVKELADI